MASEVTCTRKGRKSIENNPNVYCRLCKCSLMVKFGNSIQSCVNLFKASKREGTRGVLLSSLLDRCGINISQSHEVSQVVCNTCARKIRLLESTYDFVKKGFGNPAQETFSGKRKSVEAISPETRSPALRKAVRLRSPATKKITQAWR